MCKMFEKKEEASWKGVIKTPRNPSLHTTTFDYHYYYLVHHTLEEMSIKIPRLFIKIQGEKFIFQMFLIRHEDTFDT